MGTKICKAIMDVDPTDYDGINNLGKRLLEYLYKELTLYAVPPITQADFKVQLDKSELATSNAIEGSKLDKSIRNEEGGVLYGMMNGKLLPYVNGLYMGNRPNLEKSGFKTSSDPTPVPPPDQPVISRLVRGPEAATVKVYLVRGVNSELKKRSKKLYHLMMFEREEDMVGKEVGKSFDSRNLIGYGVPEGAYRFFAVYAENSGGVSILSSKVKFYLIP